MRLRSPWKDGCDFNSTVNQDEEHWFFRTQIQVLEIISQGNWKRLLPTINKQANNVGSWRVTFAWYGLISRRTSLSKSKLWTGRGESSSCQLFVSGWRTTRKRAAILCLSKGLSSPLSSWSWGGYEVMTLQTLHYTSRCYTSLQRHFCLQIRNCSTLSPHTHMSWGCIGPWVSSGLYAQERLPVQAALAGMQGRSRG